MFFSLPLEAGKRLPQSVQKIREPIDAMVDIADGDVVKLKQERQKFRRSTG
jgi:endonuclease YncB( thermonuclease family)